MSHCGCGLCTVEPLEQRRLLAVTWNLVSQHVAPIGMDNGIQIGPGGAYFAGTSAAHGAELWRIPSDNATPRLVRDLKPGPSGSDPLLIGTLGSHFFFAADDGSQRRGLWKTDGSAGGTVMVASSVEPKGRGVRVGEYLYFPGRDTPQASQLWRTDGTRIGTIKLGDFEATSTILQPNTFAVLHGRLAFLAAKPQSGPGVWTTQGTPETTLYSNLRTAVNTSNIETTIGAIGERVIVGSAAGLMAVDPTFQTQRLPGAFTGAGFARVGDRLWFSTSSGIWQTDGTPVGTTPVAGLTSVFPHFAKIRAFGRGVIVEAGEALWYTDGTSEGTKQIITDSFIPNVGDFQIGDLFGFVWSGKWYLTEGIGALPTSLGTQDIRSPTTLSITAARDSVYVITAAPNSHIFVDRWLWRLSPPGRITGVIYHDVNGDGRIQTGERRLKGFRVYVDKNSNGRFDSGEPSALTDSRGEYHLPWLNAGQHRIAVSGVPGWSSSGSSRVSISPATIARKHFAMFPAAVVSGAVFADNNQDRRRGSLEPGLSGWRVFVDADNDGILDTGEKSVTSDSSGNWVFPDLPAGNHTIRIVAKSGWRLTTPSGGAFLVSDCRTAQGRAVVWREADWVRDGGERVPDSRSLIVSKLIRALSDQLLAPEARRFSG